MTSKLQVFYDGLCPLCSREINHYKKMKSAGHVEWIDIAASTFDASLHGLSQDDFMREMHAKTPEGQVVTGVAAFIQIWKHLNVYHALSSLAQNPVVRPLFNLGYKIFAKIRPRLSKYRGECTTDRCER